MGKEVPTEMSMVRALSSYEDIHTSTTEEDEDVPNAMEQDEEPESEGVLTKVSETPLTPQPRMRLWSRKAAKRN